MVDAADVSRLVGGLGLFLLGMILLSDGLRTLAGERMRAWLTRFTGRPSTALATGAAATALVQSSTATTLTTIGLVSAGLLTFQQSLGVIYGANLGTTSTAWIVALLGLKFTLSLVTYPLVGAGAVMRLVGRERTQAMGGVLAGFGLLFVGIDLLQAGMASAAASVDVSGLAPSGLLGRAVLVLAGVVVTIILQSSSAAVATTLAALHAQAITLDQAAALVIGQNIGTTFTAALAAIGATVPARRTAAAHVGFNVITAAAAFVLLPWLVGASSFVVDRSVGPDPTLTLAAFHTAFNVLGILLFLPLTSVAARLLTRWIPDRGPDYARHLDPSVSAVPAVAVEASRRALADVVVDLVALARHRAEAKPALRDGPARLDRAEEGLRRIHDFLRDALSGQETGLDQARHISVVHALDHTRRLLRVLRERVHPERFADAPDLATFRQRLQDGLDASTRWLTHDFPRGDLVPARDLLEPLTDLRRTVRHEVLRRVAREDVLPARADAELEALSWAEALARHLRRALHHLQEPPPNDAPQPILPSPRPPPEPAPASL